MGMQLERMPMLNAAPALIETLVSVIDAHQKTSRTQ
jgi:protoheme ferro-lyase